MNLIIAICIFVISAFILGFPVGNNKIKSESNIKGNYNYKVLQEIPDMPSINNVILDIFYKECSVSDKRILECSNFNGELYEKSISFHSSDGIQKNIIFVIDIFEIEPVYIGKIDINYDAVNRFTTLNYPTEENVENYLIRFASDSLYFQAHPFGIDSEKVRHNGNLLKTEVMQIYYQNILTDFKIDSSLTPEEFGSYLLEQLIIGNHNVVKLKAYTQVFLVGVCFTLITVIILWFFFRKNGKLTKVSEYYNIGALTNLPISIIFFILLWFIPDLINIYIFIFSAIYVFVLFKINTSEEII